MFEGPFVLFSMGLLFQNDIHTRRQICDNYVDWTFFVNTRIIEFVDVFNCSNQRVNVMKIGRSVRLRGFVTFNIFIF